MLNTAGRERAYGKLDAGLVCRNEGEDVMFCSSIDPLQNSQIRDNAASIEVLESVEDQLTIFLSYIQIIVSRIDST